MMPDKKTIAPMGIAKRKQRGKQEDLWIAHTESSSALGHSFGKTALTRKELQTIELISLGYENDDIAAHFHTTRQAVKSMLHRVYLKLGAVNRVHAVGICFRKGWLTTGTKQRTRWENDGRKKSAAS
jgi:DNA-binding CsgD family transcriptional regulator